MIDSVSFSFIASRAFSRLFFFLFFPLCVKQNKLRHLSLNVINTYSQAHKRLDIKSKPLLITA